MIDRSILRTLGRVRLRLNSGPKATEESQIYAATH